ncbi:unnamed protein product [Paramecium octaurelia]|uniref:MORN repeat protein n=1 Tax=Paramecium octaurelia TaxID=43137 RepID=A0A8S1UJM0_PAROT|nr:unnamed protein product [Paramecium octaurelia]
MVLRQGTGLNQAMGFISIPKQYTLVNIKMEINLVDGILCIEIEVVIHFAKCKYSLQDDNYIYSGGGLFEEDNSTQIGKWIEISEEFYYNSQVTYTGVYNHGRKVGRWDIWFNINECGKKNILVGGGLYDECNWLKVGSWIEIGFGFQHLSQKIYNGEYKDGKKVGRWDINCRSRNVDPFETIGGGSYDNDLKTGKWIDLDDGFYKRNQVTYIGEYINGIKVGKWDTRCRQSNSDKFQIIGCGSYDKRGIKIGKWIQLDDRYSNSKEVLYIGEYKNGNKVGKWDIKYRDSVSSPFFQIGGGLFDEKCEGIMNGKWIQISDEFWFGKQVIYHGEYKNGKKVGKWMEMERKPTKMKEGFKIVNEVNYNQ